jgi:hypothetical protein
MLVMKHGRMKLVTFRTKNGWRNEVFTNPASMNPFHEQEQRAGREHEMAWARGRRKYIARDM